MPTSLNLPVISRINPTYASFNVDASYNRGFFHINFTNPNLAGAAQALSPSTLRFGGTGNDYLWYDSPSDPCDSSIEDSDFYGCLNTTQFKDFFNFVVNEGGMDLLFGVSMDANAYCASNESDYVWDGSNFNSWLRDVWDATMLANIWGFELGNEVNNNWAKCNLNVDLQSDGFSVMRDIIGDVWADSTSSQPLIVGPDTGYYNASSWLPEVLEKISDVGVDLHAVTHHVYAGITPDNFNDPEVLDSFITDDLTWYLPPIEEFHPEAQIWAGENGPYGGGEDGTCGPDAACGTYMTSLWYADEMANRAKHGFAQFQRQVRGCVFASLRLASAGLS